MTIKTILTLGNENSLIHMWKLLIQETAILDEVVHIDALYLVLRTKDILLVLT